MPSYLDFDSTKKFRDYIIGKTLNQPNGPQTFTSSNYSVHTLSDFPNVDPGSLDDNRNQILTSISTSNIFKPTEYDVIENLNVLPRRANLQLYPYFTSGNNTLISLYNQENLEFESELIKFSAKHLKTPTGPINARISQNLERATNGRVRLIDALNGNTTTAINIITGREPLIDLNNKITVAKSIPGKGVDFIQTVLGVEFPFSEIPGDYLSNPRNPINYRPEANTEVGRIYQDVTGALGSLIGIQRRPKLSRKPSDLMIEYMGEGQKSYLFDNLSYSRYAPDYTTSARSQNSSKVFNFVDQFAEGVKNILGVEAPRGQAYIGDDRGNDVKYAMNDFNDRPVRSNYYLSLLFDPTQAELFQRTKNMSEGGEIGGKLTWISKNRKKPSTEDSTYSDSLSTNYQFREDSILGVTQELLDTLPLDGMSSRSHVANVIDQTSRFFKEGDLILSKGSAVKKYVNKTTGQENGIEFCRVWTKDRPYNKYSNTMKRTGNIRKYPNSVMDSPWNLNIAPMSNGKKGPESFDESTNIKKEGDGFYAKKYMFSIENLAWKTSNVSGFDYNSLPYCERGPNGGRVMWFPPYGLEVSEQNNAKWEPSSFLGRPEPIYTYQNTERSGQISFKVVVDHPSILNLLVREHFEGMSDEDADNYINAFFAGCEDIDFYSLIRRYTTLTKDDITLIQNYLSNGADTTTTQKFKVVIDPIPEVKEDSSPVINSGIKLNSSLLFPNDLPKSPDITSGTKYTDIYSVSFGQETESYRNTTIRELENKLLELFPLSYNDLTSKGINAREDIKVLFGKPKIEPDEDNTWTSKIQLQKDALNREFDISKNNYTEYDTKIKQLKEDINNNIVQEVVITINSSCSAVADEKYNYTLSARRSHSIIKDILFKITGTDVDFKWSVPTGSPTSKTQSTPIEKTFKDLGFTDKEGKIIIIATNHGERANIGLNKACTDANFKDKSLKTNAPIAFGCRQSQIQMEYTKAVTTQTPQKPVETDIPPRTRLEPDGIEIVPSKNKKPPIDVMKRIIMKTLSEGYYFKILKESDPVVFSSLKEKLKYFHPGFHSMTPEGLNSRLTFIQQCIRPGSTIPIKGLSDELDLTARNTTFGTPPICVLRIGDFYHSKIIIRDVGITFNDSTWDLNPEGIGVQPMLANVTLQINFIGGQGLSKPIERLQNALSSNFYANTEMYDERSISSLNDRGTEKDKSNFETFTEEFLRSIQGNPVETADSNNTDDGKKYNNGNYIGKLDSTTNMISYGEIIDEAFKNSVSYISTYESLYGELNKIYGPLMMNLLVGNDYRVINEFDIYSQPGTTPNKTLNFVGSYKSSQPLSKLTNIFNSKIESIINVTDFCEIFGFNKVLPKTKVFLTNDIIKPYIKSFINNKIQSINENKNIKTFETVRNSLTQTLDKLNHIVKYQKDVTMKDDKTYSVTLSGYTYDMIYNEYVNVIDYISNNRQKMTEGIDTTINFNNPTINNFILGKLLSNWLSSEEEKNQFLKIFEFDKTNYDLTTLTNIKKRLDDFVDVPKDKKFKFKPLKERKNNNKKIEFEIIDVVEETDNTIIEEGKKIHAVKPTTPIGTKLNFYNG